VVSADRRPLSPRTLAASSREAQRSASNNSSKCSRLLLTVPGVTRARDEMRVFAASPFASREMPAAGVLFLVPRLLAKDAAGPLRSRRRRPVVRIAAIVAEV
jgi:hypothetical protein